MLIVHFFLKFSFYILIYSKPPNGPRNRTRVSFQSAMNASLLLLLLMKNEKFLILNYYFQYQSLVLKNSVNLRLKQN